MIEFYLMIALDVAVFIYMGNKALKTYMSKLKIIANTHGGIIKEHPVKGYRVFCMTCAAVMSSINFDGSPVRCLCEHETEKRDNVSTSN